MVRPSWTYTFPPLSSFSLLILYGAVFDPFLLHRYLGALPASAAQKFVSEFDWVPNFKKISSPKNDGLSCFRAFVQLKKFRRSIKYC